MTAWAFSGCLVLRFRGANYGSGFVFADIWHIIGNLAEDDVDQIIVERVPGPAALHEPIDRTKECARSWADNIIATRGWNGGIEPSDYLAPFPAFVRHWYGDELVDRWRAEHEPMARAS